jgi:predicted  nucleic acid-binding Zn-ribbon protein
MNNEQFERRMEFIVEQQAQFAVDIQQIKERQEAEAALWKEKQQSMNDAVTAIVGIVGRLAKAQERTDEQISKLTNKQAETDDRLNALISVVERYFSGNGHRPKTRQRKSTSSNKSQPKRRVKSPRKK